ncbi:hypothetical protein B0H63DRAFT_385723, partial [Podospora didyma]
EFKNTNAPIALSASLTASSTLTNDIFASSFSSDDLFTQDYYHPRTSGTQAPDHTAHPHGPISPELAGKYFNLKTEGDCLTVALVPVLLATLLSIPIELYTSSLKPMLPFRALDYAGGSLAEDSLCLPRSSILAPMIGIRFLWQFRDPLPILSVLLSLLATILVSLLSETIRLELPVPSQCPSGRVCPIGLRKSEMPIRAAEGLLAAMAVIILSLCLMLARWESGIATKPWSIANIASLLSTADLRSSMLSIPPRVDGTNLRDSEITRARRGGPQHSGATGPPPTIYGIGVMATLLQDNNAIPTLTVRDPPKRTPAKPRRRWSMSPRKQEVLLRSLFLFLIICLLVLILYYENTVVENPQDSPFEAFMHSQSFGVRILFTAMGTIVTAFWDYYFTRNFFPSRYHSGAVTSLPRPQVARDSILLSPPSSVFIGLWRALRTRDIMLANIALATLLAKFTPILFSSIPFRNKDTWKMHEACAWLSIAILSYMVVVLLVVSVFWGVKRRPFMPVEPTSIAGCMYYVCDSAMLGDLEGLAVMGERERDRLVCEMGRRYVFGGMVGTMSGVGSVGVDYAPCAGR